MLILADDAGPRVVMRWQPRVRGRSDLRHELVRAARAAGCRASARDIGRAIQPLAGARVPELLGYRHADGAASYLAASADCLVFVHLTAGAAIDGDGLAGALEIQPPDAPQRWAFFSVSFTVPAGFAYLGATLNLGDMTVRFERRGGARLTIRQIYPAELALSRRPHEEWLASLLEDARVRRARTRAAKAAAIDTSRGPALALDLRAVSWRGRGLRRVILLHDPAADRLICIDLLDAPARIEPAITELLTGLHWTARDV